MRAAAIVGMGAVTPLGTTLDQTWQGLLAGRSAVRLIDRFDASTFPVRIAAQGPELVPGERSSQRLGASWLAHALDEALAYVDLSAVPSHRRGVFLGAEAARPNLNTVLAGSRGQPPSRAQVEALAPWAPLAQMAQRVGATGAAAVLSTACTSSGQAVGEALLAVRRGEVDVAIAAGVDVLVHPLMVAGFARLGALSTRNGDPESASRPFDLGRDGFVLGEGAGVMVLVRADLADRVGPLRGWVRGYGGSSNAWRITDSPPDGRGASAAMVEAMSDAGIGAADLRWIHAHGTSTQQNDVSEARGINVALGDAALRVPCSSSKSMMGHLVAACGVVGAAIATRAATEGVVPATLNLERPDPECPLCHVTETRTGRPGPALVNAFGFGGVNASIVVDGP
ncbi:MAG: beta-ketoacyl synthase [Myxococcota bacterium]